MAANPGHVTLQQIIDKVNTFNLGQIKVLFEEQNYLRQEHFANFKNALVDPARLGQDFIDTYDEAAIKDAITDHWVKEITFYAAMRAASLAISQFNDVSKIVRLATINDRASLDELLADGDLVDIGSRGNANENIRNYLSQVPIEAPLVFGVSRFRQAARARAIVKLADNISAAPEIPANVLRTLATGDSAAIRGADLSSVDEGEVLKVVILDGATLDAVHDAARDKAIEKLRAEVMRIIDDEDVRTAQLQRIVTANNLNELNGEPLNLAADLMACLPDNVPITTLKQHVAEQLLTANLFNTNNVVALKALAKAENRRSFYSTLQNQSSLGFSDRGLRVLLPITTDDAIMDYCHNAAKQAVLQTLKQVDIATLDAVGAQALHALATSSETGRGYFTEAARQLTGVHPSDDAELINKLDTHDYGVIRQQAASRYLEWKILQLPLDELQRLAGAEASAVPQCVDSIRSIVQAAQVGVDEEYCEQLAKQAAVRCLQLHLNNHTHIFEQVLDTKEWRLISPELYQQDMLAFKAMAAAASADDFRALFRAADSQAARHYRLDGAANERLLQRAVPDDGATLPPYQRQAAISAVMLTAAWQCTQPQTHHVLKMLASAQDKQTLSAILADNGSPFGLANEDGSAILAQLNALSEDEFKTLQQRVRNHYFQQCLDNFADVTADLDATQARQYLNAMKQIAAMEDIEQLTAQQLTPMVDGVLLENFKQFLKEKTAESSLVKLNTDAARQVVLANIARTDSQDYLVDLATRAASLARSYDSASSVDASVATDDVLKLADVLRIYAASGVADDKDSTANAQLRALIERDERSHELIYKQASNRALALALKQIPSDVINDAQKLAAINAMLVDGDNAETRSVHSVSSYASSIETEVIKAHFSKLGIDCRLIDTMDVATQERFIGELVQKVEASLRATIAATNEPAQLVAQANALNFLDEHGVERVVKQNLHGADNYPFLIQAITGLLDAENYYQLKRDVVTKLLRQALADEDVKTLPLHQQLTALAKATDAADLRDKLVALKQQITLLGTTSGIALPGALEQISSLQVDDFSVYANEDFQQQIKDVASEAAEARKAHINTAIVEAISHAAMYDEETYQKINAVADATDTTAVHTAVAAYQQFLQQSRLRNYTLSVQSQALADLDFTDIDFAALKDNLTTQAIRVVGAAHQQAYDKLMEHAQDQARASGGQAQYVYQAKRHQRLAQTYEPQATGIIKADVEAMVLLSLQQLVRQAVEQPQVKKRLQQANLNDHWQILVNTATTPQEFAKALHGIHVGMGDDDLFDVMSANDPNHFSDLYRLVGQVHTKTLLHGCSTEQSTPVVLERPVLQEAMLNIVALNLSNLLFGHSEYAQGLKTYLTSLTETERQSTIALLADGMVSTEDAARQVKLEALASHLARSTEEEAKQPFLDKIGEQQTQALAKTLARLYLGDEHRYQEIINAFPANATDTDLINNIQQLKTELNNFVVELATEEDPELERLVSDKIASIKGVIGETNRELAVALVENAKLAVAVAALEPSKKLPAVVTAIEDGVLLLGQKNAKRIVETHQQALLTGLEQLEKDISIFHHQQSLTDKMNVALAHKLDVVSKVWRERNAVLFTESFTYQKALQAALTSLNNRLVSLEQDIINGTAVSDKLTAKLVKLRQEQARFINDHQRVHQFLQQAAMARPKPGKNKIVQLVGYQSLGEGFEPKDVDGEVKTVLGNHDLQQVQTPHDGQGSLANQADTLQSMYGTQVADVLGGQIHLQTMTVQENDGFKRTFVISTTSDGGRIQMEGWTSRKGAPQPAADGVPKEREIPPPDDVLIEQAQKMVEAWVKQNGLPSESNPMYIKGQDQRFKVILALTAAKMCEGVKGFEQSGLKIDVDIKPLLKKSPIVEKIAEKVESTAGKDAIVEAAGTSYSKGWFGKTSSQTSSKLQSTDEAITELKKMRDQLRRLQEEPPSDEDSSKPRP